jgi:hypothetical protein
VEADLQINNFSVEPNQDALEYSILREGIVRKAK